MKGKKIDYSKFKKNKSSLLKPIRHFFEYWSLRGVMNIVNLFPVSVNQFIGKVLGTLAYLVAAKDRNIALFQLDFAFPEKSTKEKKKLCKQCFQSFGQSLFEVLIINKLRKNRSKWFAWKNEQVLYDALAKGKGAIFLFGHFGNWELIPIVFEALDIRAKVIGRPIDDPRLNDLLMNSRKSSHVQVIPRGEAAASRMILSCFKNNEGLCVGLDQDTKAQSIFVDFIGRQAKTPKIAATLAMRFSAPVVSTFSFRNQDGTHTATFELISAPPYGEGDKEEYRLTQLYSKAIEKHVLKYPDQWAWFHRRWKNSPDTD